MPMTTTKPDDSAPGRRIAVIAGGGRLPELVAANLAAQGRRPFVVFLVGETDAPGLSAYDHGTLELEEFGRLVPLLKRHQVQDVVLAGSVARRPKLTALKPTWSLVKSIPSVVRGLSGGDDRLLRVIVGALSAEGIAVVGVHDVVPDLLADEGPMTKARPTASDRKDMAAAVAAARAIGELDIGQAAVAIGGRAIALEGIEGTDGLLQRVRDLRGHGRLAGKKRGVLVKWAKAGQELRADLPSIGPATVEAAHAAGLAGIGVEAGRSLVLDRDAVVRLADERCLFVVGLPAEAAAP